MTGCCRKYLREYAGRLGRDACKCRREWNHFTPGWAKPADSDRVYHRGQYIGTPFYHGDLRAMVEAGGGAELAPVPAPKPGELFA